MTFAEHYSPCSGQTFQVGKIKYKIKAEIRSVVYPLRETKWFLECSYFDPKDQRTYFLDLERSESKRAEKLIEKMEKFLRDKAE